jgi:hypothetical protein
VIREGKNPLLVRAIWYVLTTVRAAPRPALPYPGCPLNANGSWQHTTLGLKIGHPFARVPDAYGLRTAMLPEPTSS